MARRSLTAKQKLATGTQARLLAKYWGNDRCIVVCAESTTTVLACVKNGWLVPVIAGLASRGTLPSGDTFVMHEVSSAGLMALEKFLFRKRGGQK